MIRYHEDTSKDTGRHEFIHPFWSTGRCSAVVNNVMNMYMNTRIKYICFLIRDILWRSLRKSGALPPILQAYRLLDGTGGYIP